MEQEGVETRFFVFKSPSTILRNLYQGIIEKSGYKKFPYMILDFVSFVANGPIENFAKTYSFLVRICIIIGPSEIHLANNFYIDNVS